ncbi:tyrosine-type recombinase/integrase [Paraburkholderia caribensis]|uniref:Integrase family protein n=2 Tax=Paraburkholderia TaxID=1822464 RepID=B2JXE2_PARP8|nr:MULTISPECIES: tyrosine-type recombinase/integrase [Paraburkholderia]ACC76300.1 integrase family protein [Paraburkholderia phymatum STM815]MCO4882540.1 tyrosine-type recombinase/integrase [Paraburkholderia caribensis]PTB24091.1 integrase [Paraburkholderia caribensis]
MSAAPDPSDWIDDGVIPPRRLPGEMEAALAYIADALGHVVYTRWTLAAIRRRHPSLADAKTAHPAVMRLLLDHPAAIEYWDRGRVRTVAGDDAPTPQVVLQRVLHTHRRRFRHASDAVVPVSTGEPEREPAAPPTLSRPLVAWLARAGRFAAVTSATNTLGVGDDAQAVALFLRDRASRSPHTLRAYRAELRRLVAWCDTRQLGPLSDLTRHDLLAYRQALRQPAQDAPADAHRKVSEATQSRALAVIASLFRYWTETGFLTANPAAGLVRGGRSRAGFVPQRMLPPALLAACDAWVAETSPGEDALVAARRRAIWTLYRYAGVRLVELVWSDDAHLPKLDVDPIGTHEQWTLHVLGKGRKPRAIPLPAVCVPVLRTYRQLRGLPPQPPPFEQAALIHGLKGGSLKGSGLYDEVKAIFVAAADRLAKTDHAGAARLRQASPHWLRHGYARALVVDHQVPLPAAQALLGHASVQTTAAYAKTDLSQLRTFVDATFAAPAGPGGPSRSGS